MTLALLAFFAATFSLVSVGVIGYRFLVERGELSGAERDGSQAPVDWIEPSTLLKSDSFSTITLWDKVLARVDYVEIMKARLAEAGLGWSVGRLTLMMLLVGSFLFALLTNSGGFSWPLALALGLAGGALPYAYVLRRRRRRMEKIEMQFPDALDSLSRAMRAGHPLSAGMQLLVAEAPQPLAGELELTLKERAFGLSWDAALDNLAKRLPLVEVTTFVAAVKLQNRTGGRLSEVLGRLSDTMRETAALKGEVRAIAAHGRMTGTVLTILPLGIALVMTIVNPTYLVLLWTRPAGRLMVAGGALCLLLAHFVIRKMVDIRV